jgi:chorismate dehydratase
MEDLVSRGGSKVRVGAVSYLNTKPLVYDLERLAPHAEIIYDVPSRLASGLEDGQLDVALIPSIEHFRSSSYTIVSDACIGCRGRVLSVKLLSRTPIPKIRTLALDEGSRTSVALVRILLKEQHNLSPRLKRLPIGAEAEDTDADAVLLIGDRAIRPPAGVFVNEWDLGEQWFRWSGLPFVFAMWAARPDAELAGLETALAEARDAGVAHLLDIARAEAAPLNITTDECLSYLRDNLHFYLGPDEQRGLALFRRYVAELEAAAT